jgi:Flp pilus assembly protein TadD
MAMRRSFGALVALLLVALAASAEAPPWQRQLQGDDAKKAAELQKRVMDFWAAGKFAEAVEPAEDLLALRQRVQGEDHWQAVNARGQVETLKQAARLPAEQQRRLAEALGLTSRAADLRRRGQDAEAEALCRQVLAIYKETLGPRHLRTAIGYNNLALHLDLQNRRAEAEPLHRQALAIRERALGPLHPDTADSYYSLAVDLEAQSRYAEAEPLYRKLVASKEQELGPGHATTAICYAYLAANLDSQSRYAEAEPLYRKEVAIKEEALGPRHPSTAVAYSDLASNLEAQGRSGEAEPLLHHALTIREQALGPRHPVTATGYNNLAYNLDLQGKSAEAEPLLRQALAIREDALGPLHPRTATSYNNLAFNLDTQGKHAEAEPLFRRAVAVWEGTLGPRDPSTATGYRNLALNLDAQGKHAEAEPLHRKALAIMEEVLGPRYLDTALSNDNLALNLDAQGKHTEAEARHRKAVTIKEQVLSPRHPSTAISYSNLGLNLDAQGKHAEAERLHRQAVTICEQALGPRHPDTALSYNNRALNLDAQGMYAEAERSWRAAVAAFEVARLRTTATGFQRAAAARVQPHFGLALCLARQGKPAEAWEAAEAGLARGLLDDLAARRPLANNPEDAPRLSQRAARLDQLDGLLVPLLAAEQLPEADRKRGDELSRERAALLEEVDREAADQARGRVLPLEHIQKQLPADAAVVVWIDLPPPTESTDPGAWHWACVVRRSGPPAWVRLPGSGAGKGWTEDDDELPGRFRQALGRRAPGWEALAGRLRQQRLDPLQPLLAATADLPAARRLVVVPVTALAGVPLEALAEGYALSYAPSGTVFARLAEGHRPLREPSLLAVGDPAFARRDDPPVPRLPDHGVLIVQVLPGGNAEKAGLRTDDILLGYGDRELIAPADLKLKEDGDPVPVRVWRDGRTRELTVAPGKLDVLFHREPAAEALKQRRERQQLLAATRGPKVKPLAGTRREVEALAALFPKDRTQLLLGPDASEQRLDEMAAEHRLKDFRVLHFATHGAIDRDAPLRSALLLADGRLPDATARARAGEKVYTGRLTAGSMARWGLDADLVVLSACDTGLGKEAGGEGYLGFSQVLFGAGARSLVVSLWQVDDASTALLMARFYENLLGGRDGLNGPLPRAEALHEAQYWLRNLPRAEAEALAAKLTGGELRGTLSPLKPAAPPPGSPESGGRPYAHPYYWSAFVLLGDPD